MFWKGVSYRKAVARLQTVNRGAYKWLLEVSQVLSIAQQRAMSNQQLDTRIEELQPRIIVHASVQKMLPHWTFSSKGCYLALDDTQNNSNIPGTQWLRSGPACAPPSWLSHGYADRAHHDLQPPRDHSSPSKSTSIL